jgi:hypothetical protein
MPYITSSLNYYTDTQPSQDQGKMLGHTLNLSTTAKKSGIPV